MPNNTQPNNSDDFAVFETFDFDDDVLIKDEQGEVAPLKHENIGGTDIDRKEDVTKVSTSAVKIKQTATSGAQPQDSGSKRKNEDWNIPKKKPSRIAISVFIIERTSFTSFLV